MAYDQLKNDFEALKALLDSSEFNGTGEPQTLRFLDDYDIFPKGSIRIAVYNADSSPDPDNPSRYFVVSPEGSLYWVQRGPVGFSTTDMLQYICSRSQIISYPYAIDYNAVNELVSGNS